MIKSITPEHEGGTAVMDVSGLLEQREFPWGIVSATGVVLRDDTSEKTWLFLAEQAIGLWERLGQTHLGLSMKVADILNWGEEHLGERYSQAIDLCRKSLTQQSKTVENWQRVFKAVPPSRRRETLTYSHHEAVVKLDASEQEEFLKLADEDGMTVKALKDAIRTRHPAKPRNAKPRAIVSVDDTWPAMMDAMTRVLNFLKAHECEITDEHQPLLSDYSKLYRRHFQTGHKKADA